MLPLVSYILVNFLAFHLCTPRIAANHCFEQDRNHVLVHCLRDETQVSKGVVVVRCRENVRNLQNELLRKNLALEQGRLDSAHTYVTILAHRLLVWHFQP
jgi:hypothetical protein